MRFGWHTNELIPNFPTQPLLLCKQTQFLSLREKQKQCQKMKKDKERLKSFQKPNYGATSSKLNNNGKMTFLSKILLSSKNKEGNGMKRI